MKPILVIFILLLAGCNPSTESEGILTASSLTGKWIHVDGGFTFVTPPDWKRTEYGRHSHTGRYTGNNAYLEFAEVYSSTDSKFDSVLAIQILNQKKSAPELLKPGEEIWHIDDHVILFSAGKTDFEIFKESQYENMASVFIPYINKAAYLSIQVFFKSDAEKPDAIRILRSIKLNEKH